MKLVVYLAIAGGLLSLLLLWTLRRPLGLVLRLAGRTALGICLLAALSRLELWSIGVNLCNGVILGFLGVPGFGLLLMMNLLL